MASITKRGDSWFVQIRRRGFRPRYRSFEARSAALQWARSEESDIDRGLGRCEGRYVARLTVRQLLSRYSVEVSAHKKGAEQEQIRLEKMQLAPFAELPAIDLTPAAIAAYRDERLASVKPATIKRELGILRRVIEVARLEWSVPIRENPVALVSLPKVNDARERRVSDQELSSICRALQNGRNVLIEPMALLAIETSLRRGELLKLEWQDLDFERRIAKIRDTKNGSDRTIPLSRAAVAILLGLSRPADLVFPTTPNAVRQSWRRACRRANVANLRFHDLRHEAISRFFELGLSVPEVALISGHKDARMLFRYTHLMPETVRDRLDRLNGSTQL